MAIPVSSVASNAVTAQTSVSTAPRETTSNTSTDPFQTILAQTTTSAQSPQAAREANQAVLSADTADQAEQDRLDRAAEAADETAAAQLAALLGLPQLAAANTPITDPPLLATSQLAGDARQLVSPELNRAQQSAAAAQANSLSREPAPQVGQQNTDQLFNAVPQTAPADSAATPAAAAAAPAAPVPLPEPAANAVTPATAGSATAVVNRVQRQVVVAQTPIVPGLLPTPPDAGANTALPTPVVAPTAPVETAAVPEVTVGDRPGTAGDRFAAIASAATTLLPSPAPALSGAFTQVLTSETAANTANADLVPNQLAEPAERRTTADRFGEAVAVTGAQAPVPAQNPNAVTAAQTTTGVRTPDPVVQVADHIVTHAHLVARGGETEFRMRLDPPELGAVKIRLVSDGDSIHGQVVVSNDAIRRMIESQLPELRQRLEDAGVSVQNFNVATDANPNAGAGNGGEWGGYRSEFPAEPPRQPVAPLTGRPPAARARGAVDVMA